MAIIAIISSGNRCYKPDIALKSKNSFTGISGISETTRMLASKRVYELEISIQRPRKKIKGN